MSTFGDRETALAQIANSEASVTALRAHVLEIVEGPAFKGSHRSGQFLSYIVDHAIGGHFESLKERVIGIELFGRSPSYDTSEDAIVRVTASDVRKRLLQHYGRRGETSEFRVSLPPGSYVPEIIHTPHREEERHESRNGLPETHKPAGGEAAAQHKAVGTLAKAEEAKAPAKSAAGFKEKAKKITAKYPWLWIALGLIVFNIAGWVLLLRDTTQKAALTTELLPWSVFFSSARPIHLVTSDPDIAEIQMLTHSRISVSDYANHNYLPTGNKLSPEIQQICLTMLDGRKAATLDATVAAGIAGVARNSAKAIEVEGAREFQFANLKTDDNFIFLGSPSSDPWFLIFNDQLDFRMVADPNSGGEVIQNVHPVGSEQTVYSPTSRGGSTGQSYAVVAFIANRDQDGHVLLLAGTNGEATQAAGKLVTDLPRLSTALQQCGIPKASPPRHFEMLLRVESMARYPEQFDVVACHVLPGGGH